LNHEPKEVEGEIPIHNSMVTLSGERENQKLYFLFPCQGLKKLTPERTSGFPNARPECPYFLECGN